MNREDVAMDVTVQNVEILRNRVAELEHPEQAEGAKREREEFSAWWNHAAQWELRKSCAMGWGEKVWRAARAALAQPSPALELVNALRQYQHNDCSGVVFGYDKAETDRIVGALREEASGWKAMSIVAANGKDELRHKLEAAQAMVAELELKLSTSDYAYDSRHDHMRGMAREAADAIQVFTGHDSGANLKHYYGEKWWEPLNELRDQLHAFVNDAPVAQAGQVPEWIACTERLPASGEPVIAWCSGSNQAGVAWIRQGAWLMPEPQALGYESITHWAPLPAAPQPAKGCEA